MKIESGIRVVRTPYEEPYHTQITITASNGSFTGETDLYCGVDELIEIGQALARFPTKVPDEYEFIYGSANPADRFYRFFRFRANRLLKKYRSCFHTLGSIGAATARGSAEAWSR